MLSFTDNQIPQLVEDGTKLDRYLFSRHIPLEQKEIYLAKKGIEKELLTNVEVHRASELGSIMILQIFAFIIGNNTNKKRFQIFNEPKKC